MKYSDVTTEQQGFVRKNVEMIFGKMPAKPDQELMVLDIYGTEVYFQGKIVSRFADETTIPFQ